jgi:hypothetical protein
MDAGTVVTDTVDEPKPKRRSWLRRGRGVLVLGVAALGLVGWAWDATHHDHEEAHGRPGTVAEIQQLMHGSFTTDAGGTAKVDHATCHGDGEPVNGLYLHFDCSLIFADGNGDEVLVHLLENDEIFFVSSVAE